jgi:hypothetical protein
MCGVAVKKYVQSHTTTSIIAPDEVGKVRRNVKRLRRFRGLKTDLGTEHIYGEQSVGSCSFFSSVFTVGRVFFTAQP